MTFIVTVVDCWLLVHTRIIWFCRVTFPVTLRCLLHALLVGCLYLRLIYFVPVVVFTLHVTVPFFYAPFDTVPRVRYVAPHVYYPAHTHTHTLIYWLYCYSPCLYTHLPIYVGFPHTVTRRLVPYVLVPSRCRRLFVRFVCLPLPALPALPVLTFAFILPFSARAVRLLLFVRSSCRL